MPKKLAEEVADRAVEQLQERLAYGRVHRASATDGDVREAVTDSVTDALLARRPKAVFEVNALLVEQMRSEGAFVPESRARALAEALVDAAWGIE